MLTTAQAATILQVSRRRVQALITAGRLPAQKHGRDWLIARADLALVTVRRGGRPRKEKQLAESKQLIRFDASVDCPYCGATQVMAFASDGEGDVRINTWCSECLAEFVVYATFDAAKEGGSAHATTARP